jgi:uncharacterized protein DUF3465
MTSHEKLLLPAIVFVAIALFGYGRHHSPFSDASTSPAAANDSVFASAFAKHASNIRVEGQGTVAKILPDDNDGSRHQRFIVRLSSGQTIVIAHNIDLAPRVSSLNEGDVVAFSGEYEWNPKGGVVHWTHRDPDGGHSAGWIRHDGQAFQ